MTSNTQYKQTEIGEIPDEWQVVELGNLVDVIGGAPFKGTDFISDGFPVIKIANVKPMELLLANLDCISRETAQVYQDALLRKQDLLITMTGNRYGGGPDSWVGKVALFNEDSRYYLNQRVGILRCKNSHSADIRFLAYYLGSIEMQRQFVMMATGAGGQANISPSQIKRQIIPLPEIFEQQQIASILSVLGNKIELNRKMNKTLEELGKVLFKRWFVDFEFLNEEGKPYKSSGGEMIDSELGEIPNGWKVENINSVSRVRRGASPRPIQNFMNGSVPWVKIADATRAGGQFIFDTKEFVTEEGRQRSVLLKPGSLILSNSATCGIPTFLEIEGCIHDGWLYFDSYQDITKEYLFYTLERLGTHLVQIADGSVQRNLNTSIVGSQKIIVPLKDILDEFTAVAALLFKKQKENLVENQLLTNIRNSILPRLMSGKLRIPQKGDLHD